MKFWIFVIMFFSISALLIINNYNLAMYKSENVQEFGELYVGWLDEIYQNVYSLSGYIVKMEWLPAS